MNQAKLYVGNLNYDTSEATLRTAFEAHGTVSTVNLIVDRNSGRPKGFGFVEMGTQEEAEKAIQALNGVMHEGRTLTVNMSKPRSDSDRGGRGRPSNRW